jgi:hypothetical protein
MLLLHYSYATLFIYHIDYKVSFFRQKFILMSIKNAGSWILGGIWLSDVLYFYNLIFEARKTAEKNSPQDIPGGCKLKKSKKITLLLNEYLISRIVRRRAHLDYV